MACGGPGDGTPCPLGKRSTSPRCPDCTLAHQRLRAQRKQAEEAKRLARITASTPPASTIDGALQRWRDGKVPEGFVKCIGPGTDTLNDKCPVGEYVDGRLNRRCEACVRTFRQRRSAAPRSAVESGYRSSLASFG
jgi:hypothetical protein